MDDRLKNAYTKVINKHYAAVQTDELLGHSDEFSPSLEQKAKQFWADYTAAEQEFKALLERCTLREE
jgi:hypothetical protein